MKFIDTLILAHLLFEPKKLEFDSLCFNETYKKINFFVLGVQSNFIQDDYSRSTKNVLRGVRFHFNNLQSQFLREMRGNIFNVAVDLYYNLSHIFSPDGKGRLNSKNRNIEINLTIKKNISLKSDSFPLILHISKKLTFCRCIK